MCGICGIINDDFNEPVGRHVLETMNETMVHRGPDDEGYFTAGHVGLAMRRLSIIDVAGGRQPMTSEDGRVVVVCNGEIYNFKELKDDLKKRGHHFKTNSDIEVLPHLYEEFGESFLQRLNGMFGLALWDGGTKALFLARDRMGKKPLYYAHQGGRFVFGSELKVLLAHPNISFEIDRRSLSKYLAFEYIPAPHTIFRGCNKLEAGHFLKFKDGRVVVARYWDVPVDGPTLDVGEDEAAVEVQRLLKRSVERRLISDVPLGVFLSGGIDSSSVVAMMSELIKPSKIKTFSIAFVEKTFDESSYARQVAKHFGVDHREETCTPSDLLQLLPKVCDVLDEPFADPSIIPTFALSKFTREYVTVALGGDGGDELFAGYPTFIAEKFAGPYLSVPAFLRKGLIEPLAGLLPVSDKSISFDFKVKQFLKGVYAEGLTRHMIWMGAFSPLEQQGLLIHDSTEGVFEDVFRYTTPAVKADSGNRLLYLYKKLYLAEDILTKVDRASMGVSLEVRAPFLDYELVEYVARLPYKLKLRGLTMKHILKKAMGESLPKGIAKRGKKGFSVPIAKWFKGPLLGLARGMLEPSKIKREGFFRPEFVTTLLDDHISGRVDNRDKLWSLLMFEQWLERWGV